MQMSVSARCNSKARSFDIRALNLFRISCLGFRIYATDMDYHVKRVSRNCATTGRELTPGEVCHSVLLEQDGQFVRLDYSEEGWSGPPPNAVGVCKSTIPEPVAVKKKSTPTRSWMPVRRPVLGE